MSISSVFWICIGPEGVLEVWWLSACSAVQCLLQLSSIGVPNEEDNRRALRELLFTAPGVEDHISGVVSISSPHTQPSRTSHWACQPQHIAMVQKRANSSNDTAP